MIKRILMKNVASFGAEGVDIDGMRRVNLIYGANGSGKSTVAKFIEAPHSADFACCALEEEGRDQNCVFDRDYIARQFRGNALTGIFTIGSESIELKEELAALCASREEATAKLAALQEEINCASKSKDDAASAFYTDLYKNLCKAYSDDYPEIFKGYKSSREKFATLMLSTYGYGDLREFSFDELAQRYALLFGDVDDGELSPLPQMSADFAAFALVVEQSAIWRDSATGRKDLPISKRVAKLGNQDWLHSGLSYLDGDICPFCGQHTVSEQLVKQMQDYFEGAFGKTTSVVEDYKKQYERFAKYIGGYLASLGESGPALRVAGVDEKAFGAMISAVKNIVDYNLAQIASKLDRPSLPVELKSSDDALNDLCVAVIEINAKLATFKELCASKKREQTSLKRDFWAFLSSRKKDAIAAYIKARNSYDTKLDALNNSAQLAKQNVADIDKNIAAIKQTLSGIASSADRINAMLDSYGFCGFRLKAIDSDGSYAIVREDGSNAIHTVSEGEQNLLAFLYFAESLNGELAPSFDGRTVVLDDPVSGLDGDSIAIVAAITSSLAARAEQGDSLKQLTVLTHNRDYLSQISAAAAKAYTLIKRDGKTSVVSR